jgi:HK97 family phage prohead protease
MDRAYSLLQVKSVDEDARLIEGIATTPAPDRVGDVVEPMGAKFAVPLPLLWQHQHDKPVGSVEFAKPTKAGIPFRARIAKIAEPGVLKDRVDEAWQSVKAGLVSAVSIGFRALEHSRMEGGGIRFLEWEWLELSLVTVPANSGATITAIKAIDREHLPASREIGADDHRKTHPGASGTKPAASRGSVKLIPRNRK